MPVRKNQKGFVDPLSIAIVSFLVTTLVVGVSVTNNPVKRFLINSLAIRTNESGGGGSSIQVFKDTTAETSGATDRENKGAAKESKFDINEGKQADTTVVVPRVDLSLVPVVPVVDETPEEEQPPIDLQHPVGGYDFDIVYEKEQATARIGYCYNTSNCKEGDQIAGFYYIEGKGYYPIGEKAGGPTVEDLSYIPKKIAEQQQTETIDTSGLTLKDVVGEDVNFTGTPELNQNFELSLYRKYASGENLSLEPFVIDYCQSAGKTNCESNAHAYAILKLKEAGYTTTDIEQKYQEAQKALEPEPVPVVQPKTPQQQISDTKSFDYTKTDPLLAKSVAEVFNLKPGPYTPEQNLYTYDRVKEEQYQSTVYNQVGDIPKAVDYSQVEDQRTTTAEKDVKTQGELQQEASRTVNLNTATENATEPQNYPLEAERTTNLNNTSQQLTEEEKRRLLTDAQNLIEPQRTVNLNTGQNKEAEITTQYYPLEAERTVNLNTIKPNVVKKLTQSLLEANRTVNTYTSNSTLVQKLSQVLPLNNLTTSWKILNEITFQNQPPLLTEQVSRFDLEPLPETEIPETAANLQNIVGTVGKSENTAISQATSPSLTQRIAQAVGDSITTIFNKIVNTPEQATEIKSTTPDTSSMEFMRNTAYETYKKAEIAFQNAFPFLSVPQLASPELNSEQAVLEQTFENQPDRTLQNPPEGLTSKGAGLCNRTCDGERIYKLYEALRDQKDGWWYHNGEFTPADFLALMLIAESTGNSPEFLSSIIVATSNQLWGSAPDHDPYCTTPDCAAGVFNFLGSYTESTTRRWNNVLLPALASGGYPSPEDIEKLAASKYWVDYFASYNLSIEQIADHTVYNPISEEWGNDVPVHWGSPDLAGWTTNYYKFGGASGTYDKCGVYYLGGGDVVFTLNQESTWQNSADTCKNVYTDPAPEYINLLDSPIIKELNIDSSLLSPAGLYVQTDSNIANETVVTIDGEERTYRQIGCAPVALANIMTEYKTPTSPEDITIQIPENEWAYNGINFFGNALTNILEGNGFQTERYRGNSDNLWDRTEPDQIIILGATVTSSNNFLKQTAHDTYMVPTEEPGIFVLRDKLPIKDSPDADLLICKAGSGQTFECSNDTGEWARIDTTNQTVLITTVP